MDNSQVSVVNIFPVEWYRDIIKWPLMCIGQHKTFLFPFEFAETEATLMTVQLAFTHHV